MVEDKDFKDILKRLDELEKYKQKKEKEERKAKEKEKDDKIKSLENKIKALEAENLYNTGMLEIYRSIDQHKNILSVPVPSQYLL